MSDKKDPVDPRITRLIEAVRALAGCEIDTHVVGPQMTGLHQIRINLHDVPGPRGTLFQGSGRSEFTELVEAVADATPLLQEFLQSHWFAETFDEVRGQNERLMGALHGIQRELRRIAVFEN